MSFALGFTSRHGDREKDRRAPMKIDFDMLEKLAAAGATAQVVITFLREQEAKKAPKRARDRTYKRTRRQKNGATTGDNGATSSDIERHEATIDDPFEEFWKAYPKRAGANPKAPARKLFIMAVKAGCDPAAIIGGARRCAVIDSKKVGTEYIPQATRWLRDRRWEDYPVAMPFSLTLPQIRIETDTPQWEAWQDHLKQTTGRGSPCVNFGWNFPSEWPPDYVPPNTCLNA